MAQRREAASLAAQLLRRGVTRWSGGSCSSSARSASSAAAPAGGAAGATPFDAARSTHEIELAKLRLAAAEAADRAAARTLELQRLQQGRGAWEAHSGLNPQRLKLWGGAALVLVAYVACLANIVQDARAEIRISETRSQDAALLARSLLSNAQRAPAAPPQLRALAPLRGVVARPLTFISAPALPPVTVPQPPPQPPPQLPPQLPPPRRS